MEGNLNLNTAQETAAKWNVSTRNIQYMCKQGKIKGAIKMAGAWFIPSDAPIPVKNSKGDTLHYQFVGTKKRIFDNAIKLFMTHGFEEVSICDIAGTVGIGQSAMYNHFKSKQQILDTIYDYYCHFYLADRPTLEDLDPILQDGSPLDIVKCLHYDFKDDYMQNLQYITIIVYQRISIDKRAKEIAKTLILDEGMRYVETVFDRAVKMGRLAPLDTHAMAVFINSVRLATLHSWIIDDSPENLARIVKDEMTLYEFASKLLTDLKPMAQRNLEARDLP